MKTFFFKKSLEPRLSNYSQSRDYYYKYKALKYYLKNNSIENQKQIKGGAILSPEQLNSIYSEYGLLKKLKNRLIRNMVWDEGEENDLDEIMNDSEKIVNWMINKLMEMNLINFLEQNEGFEDASGNIIHNNDNENIIYYDNTGKVYVYESTDFNFDDDQNVSLDEKLGIIIYVMGHHAEYFTNPNP
jgi:hypothetical protein